MDKINRATVTELDRLYRKREDLQRSREYAMDRNFWLGFFNEMERGTGTRSTVVSAIGGTGALTDIVKRAVVDHFETLQRELDGKIEDLGGQP